MTVNQLHKALGKLIAEGKGRVPVAIHKETFSHNCEPEAGILDVVAIRCKPINMLDDDGGIKVNKDGTESLRRTAILYGAAWEPEQ